MRLTEMGREIGLVDDDERWARFEIKKNQFDNEDEAPRQHQTQASQGNQC